MGSSLAARLESDDARATVTAFPDGSIDTVYHVHDGDGRIERREAFVEAITAGRSPAVTRREVTVEPGGHAVNMAQQAALLGDDATVVGHLDDPVLQSLPVKTVSMGAPTTVDVLGFDDADVLIAEPSADAETWSVERFRTATDGRFASLLSADLVFCANWATFDALPDVLSAIAAAEPDGGDFLVDPGRIASRSDEDLVGLVDALAGLTDAFDVVLSANDAEMCALAGALDSPGGDPDGRAEVLDRVRRAGSLTAAVVHEVDAAAVATADGHRTVENVEVAPTRHTGGGDRFDAGLAHALSRGWSWQDALRLGNACAARYIATGESATTAELAAFLRDHR